MAEIIEYKGKDIYYLDATKYSIKDLQSLEDDMNEMKALVKKQPLNSVLIITNVSNIVFNKAMTDLFKDYASHNTPYVKGSVLVGISGMQKVVLTTVKKVTGRDYKLLDTMESAKEWLVNL